MSDANDFFTALHDRDDDALKTDGEALVEVAERGLCHAARDISMPGIAGSLLQMAEGANVGARLDLDATPAAGRRPIERWLLTFPSFGFLLAAPEHTRRRRSTRSRGAASPARPAAPSTTRRALTLAGGRPRRLGPRPEPLTRPLDSAYRHRLVHDAAVDRRVAVRTQPSRSKNRTFATCTCATIRAPPSSPAVATAKFTSSPPSRCTRASGSTASRSPFQSPEPSGYSRTVAHDRAVDRRDRVHVSTRLVPRVAVVAHEQRLLLDEDRAGARRSARRAGGVGGEPASSAARQPTKRSSSPCAVLTAQDAFPRGEPGARLAARAAGLRVQMVEARVGEHRRHLAVDRARRSPGRAVGASAISVPGTGRSGTTNG